MPERGAKELLEQTLSAYRRLSSYEDEGAVLVGSAKQEARFRTTFETRFLRPDLFQFKFSNPHPHPPLAHIITTCICGFDGSSAYLWTRHHEDEPTIQTHESILMAVAAATGISSGSAHTIAQFLLSDADGGGLMAMEDVVLGADETVEETVCSVVRGRLPDADVEMSFFIDPRTLTLRKLATRFDEFSSEEIRRNIRLDAPIDRSIFRRPEGEPGPTIASDRGR